MIRYRRNAVSPILYILKDPRGTVTCICDKLLKHFFPLVSLQKSRHITQQTRPKTTTWHFADPRSLPPDREKGGEKKMTAALDLTSNAGERVRKRERGSKKKKKNGYISAVTACWKSLANGEQFLSPSLSHPFYLSISPLSVSLSHQNLPPIRISASHALWMGCENTRRTQGVKRQD